jgi:hypothetical protein
MTRSVLFPGLFTLLAAANPAAHGEDVDLFDGKVELKAELVPTPAELKAEDAAAAVPEERLVGIAGIAQAGVEFVEIIDGDIFVDPFAVVLEVAEEAGGERERNPDEPLSADDEKAVQEFVTKAAAARRKELEKRLVKTIKGLAKAANADAAAEEKLEALATPVLDAAMADWEKKCREWVMDMINRSGQGAASIRGWQPDQFGAGNQVQGALRPEETGAWKDGLKQILTDEQRAAVAADEQARRAKLREDLADYLKSSEAQAGEWMANLMDGVVRRLLLHAEFDDERRAKLKQAADEAVKVTLAAWRERAELQLMEMDETTRDQMTQRGGLMGVNTNEKANQPQEQPSWKEAVAKILTGQEQAQLEAQQSAVRARRAEAIGMVLLADLDRLIGLNEPQRTSLLELMKKPLEGLPSNYFESPDDSGYYAIDLPQVMRQVRGIDKEKLAALLDAGQLKRWKTVNPSMLTRSGYVRERLDPGKLPAPEEMDEVEVERAVSGFLHREARKMEQKMQSIMEAQVENIVRVANPPAEAVAVLNTAAKGAAEQMAENSIGNLANWVRNQFQNVKPADVPARLQNLSNPYFDERQRPQEPRVWSAAVQRHLTEQQREAWKSECASRDAWRLRALTAMVVTELEKRLPLKPEQREKLQRKLTAVITDYEPDFSMYFSLWWYLQGYYTLVPLAMFSDKELEECFDKKQLENVKESTS